MLKDNILSALKSKKGISVVSFAVGLGVGSSAGYFVLNRVLSAKYDERLDIEIERTKNYYRILKKEEYATPADFLARALVPITDEDVELANMLSSYGDLDNTVHDKDIRERLDISEVDEDDEVVKNIFDEDEESDQYKPSAVELAIYDRAKAEKMAGNPYPITESEYFTSEDGEERNQRQMTWWVRNRVLVDESDNQVAVAPIGETNLDLFEQLTEDGTTIYIHSPKTNVYYEITLDDGNYDYEVQNIIEHSDRHAGSRKIPHFRGD